MQENTYSTWDLVSISGSGSFPGEGNGNPVFLPGKCHGQRSHVNYSSQGRRVRLDLATKPPPLSQSRLKKKMMMSLKMRSNQRISGTGGIDRAFCDVLKLHSWGKQELSSRLLLNCTNMHFSVYFTRCWFLKKANEHVYNQVNEHEFEQAQGDGEGQGGLACCSPWGCRVGHDLELNNNSMINI